MRLTRFALLGLSATFLLLLSQRASATIPWFFLFGDSTDTVVGVFTTNGDPADLAGTGTIDFVVSGLVDVQLNSLPPGLANPLDPTSADGQMLRWDRDAAEVSQLLNGGLLFWFGGSGNESQLSLSLAAGSEFGSLLSDSTDNDPNIGPFLASLIAPAIEIPVPEPATAGLLLGGLLAAVGLRRVLRS